MTELITLSRPSEKIIIPTSQEASIFLNTQPDYGRPGDQNTVALEALLNRVPNPVAQSLRPAQYSKDFYDQIIAGSKGRKFGRRPALAILVAGALSGHEFLKGATPAQAKELQASGMIEAWYRPDPKGVWYSMFPGAAGVTNPINMDDPGGPLDTYDARMLVEFGLEAFGGMVPNSLGYYRDVMKKNNDDPQYKGYAGFCAAANRQQIYDDKVERPTVFTDANGQRRVIDEARFRAEGTMLYSGQFIEKLSIRDAARYMGEQKFAVSVDLGGNAQVWQYPAWRISPDYLTNPDPLMTVVKNGQDVDVRMSSASDIWRVPVVNDASGARPARVYDMTDEQIIKKGYWINPWMWPEMHEHNRVAGSPKPDAAALNRFLEWRRRLNDIFQNAYVTPIPWI